MRIGIHIHWWSRWRALNETAKQEGRKYLKKRTCRCGKQQHKWMNR